MESIQVPDASKASERFGPIEPGVYEFIPSKVTILGRWTGVDGDPLVLKLRELGYVTIMQDQSESFADILSTGELGNVVPTKADNPVLGVMGSRKWSSFTLDTRSDVGITDAGDVSIFDAGYFQRSYRKVESA